MIQQFRHKGLKRFFHNSDESGIVSDHAKTLAQQLDKLEAATHQRDMDLPGWRFKTLKGGKENAPKVHQVDVHGAWRLRFEFHEGDAYVVDYGEFH